MKRNVRRLFMSLMLAAAGSLAFSAAGLAKDGGTYYTKVNIWYEKPDKILSTNYHKGTVIPAGTEVEVLKRGKKISFREKESGDKFTLVQVKKFTDVSKDELFDRHFSEQNPLKGKEYNSFSEMEKKNIKDGELEDGMSKAAVIMAYGYPPTHRTPSLDDNTWVFWRNRFANFPLRFKNDRIVNFDD